MRRTMGNRYENNHCNYHRLWLISASACFRTSAHQSVSSNDWCHGGSGAMMSGLVMYMKKMMKDEIIQSVDGLHESVGTIEVRLEKDTTLVLQGCGHIGISLRNGQGGRGELNPRRGVGAI